MQSLLEYLSSNESRFVEELCDYVRFPSVSAQEKHSKDLLHCAEWLRAHCRAIGLEAELEKTAGNPILVAKTPRRPGKRRPHFLATGLAISRSPHNLPPSKVAAWVRTSSPP